MVDDAGIGDGIQVRKVAGLLGETEGLGTDDPRAIVGIGVNVDWPAAAFPPELAASMTSLREIAGRPVDREILLGEFLARLEARLADLEAGRFDAAGWADRQVTTGRLVRLEGPDGAPSSSGRVASMPIPGRSSWRPSTVARPSGRGRCSWAR